MTTDEPRERIAEIVRDVHGDDSEGNKGRLCADRILALFGEPVVWTLKITMPDGEQCWGGLFHSPEAARADGELWYGCVSRAVPLYALTETRETER